MSLMNFCCLCMFMVFARQIESRVLSLRDNDDDPLVLGYVDRSSAEEVKHKYQPISSNYKPIRTHSKSLVLQYGRYIYHLDNFADLKDLRSKMSQLKSDSVLYDYADIDDLFRGSDSAKQGVGDYLKDILIFSNTPVQFCSGDQCYEDLRKFSKHKNYDDTDQKLQVGRSKRFQIVDNRHRSKKYDDSLEKHHEKKRKSTKKNKKKKKKHSSESTESKSKESGSAEKSFLKKTKKKNKPPKSSEETSVDIKRKPKKKHNDDDSSDASVEKWLNHDKDSKSNEDFRKKKKKNNYGASDETKRKTFADVEEDFFMQGNKIFHAKAGKSKKKHYDFDKRRRLKHFLPKRYHWDPSEIHDLGYYWFNGPKGSYSAPKPL